MPSIQEAMQTDLSGYKPAEPVASPPVAPPATNEPYYNPFLRSPLPPIWSASPDSLRQFTGSGVVPQRRIFTASNTGSSGTVTLNEFASGVTSGGSSGGSGGSTTPSGPTAAQSAIITNALAPNATTQATLQAAKGFQLLGLIATRACRVRLYGTSLARSIDAGRPLDVSPPAGSTQNIICDVVLDTSPLTWAFQARVGANADNPQSKVIYAAITNLSAASGPVTVTVSYVPLEN